MEERPLEAPTPKETIMDVPPKKTVIDPTKPQKSRRKKVTIEEPQKTTTSQRSGCSCDGGGCGCDEWDGAVKRRSKKFY
jgi:hypothetical protein